MGVLANCIQTGLLVEDVGKMVAFYRDILGMETEYTDGPFASFKIREGGLFMFDRKIFARDMRMEYVPPRGVNQTMEVCVSVPEKSDVIREYERLTALGVSSLTGEPATQPWGSLNFWIADPEGNLIEIVC